MGKRLTERTVDEGAILGVDPGRDKTGWAFVAPNGDLILSGVLPTSQVEVFLNFLDCPDDKKEAMFESWTCERRSFVFKPSKADLKYVALGNGTGSREIVPLFQRFDVKTVLVDERGSTLAARELYWRLYRPLWWQNFLPCVLRFPPRDVDDLAAWEIALRSEKFCLEQT